MLTQVTLVAFEAFAVSTAMPLAARDLGGVRQYGLAFSLFFTTSLLGIVVAGGWTDRSGPRGPVVAGLLLFSGGLVTSGLATSFPVLLVGRAVSGAGGGLLVVSLYVVVAVVYPREAQPRVFGAISAAWVLPSVLGPPVAGLLATEVSWRAVFLLVPPIAVAPLVVLRPRLAAITSSGPDDAGQDPAPAAQAGSAASAGGPGDGPLPPPEPGVVPALTLRGRVLRGTGLAVGATVLQWALQWGAQGAGVLRAGLVVLAGAALAAVCAPALLPRGTWRLRRGLASLVVTRAMITGSYFGAETFVPLMLVDRRGLSPALAGLALTLGALGWSAGSLLQGRGTLPVPRTTLLPVGGAVVGVAVLGLVLTPLGDVPWWTVSLVWVLAGFGMGLAMSSTSVLTLRLSPPGEAGRNGSALQIGDALGSVVGIGVAGAVFAALYDPAGPSGGGPFALIWAVLGGGALLAALVSRRVARARPASTPSPAAPASPGPR